MRTKNFTRKNSQVVRQPKGVSFPTSTKEAHLEKTSTGSPLLKPHKNFDWDSFFDETEAKPIDISIVEDQTPDTERQDRIVEQLNTGIK